MRPLKKLRHAARMVWRNRRSYVFLSVTIILSFSLLLGYLVLTDSRNYNYYKFRYARDRSTVLCNMDTGSEAVWEIFAKRLDRVGDTHYYSLWEANVQVEERRIRYPGDWTGEKGVTVWIQALPSNVFGLYGGFGDPLTVTWLDGESRENIHLGPGELLVGEDVYRMMPEGSDRLSVTLVGHEERDGYLMGVACPLEGRVVGVVSRPAEMENLTVYAPVGDWNPSKQPQLSWWERRQVVIHTAHPEEVYYICKGFQTVDEPVAVYRDQEEAMKQQRIDARTKAVITGALFLLLGINLYSSFSNALNERKFEIGVRRAIGAGAGEIVGQFAAESLLVLLADIALSVFLVADAAVIYKYVKEHIPDGVGRYHQYILHLTPWSAGMFLVCALSLTLVFSLLFSYQATRVQIVNYLKGE